MDSASYTESLGIFTFFYYIMNMGLQSFITFIVVASALVFVLHTFVRQFRSTGHKGCSSCNKNKERNTGVPQDDGLIQVESVPK